MATEQHSRSTDAELDNGLRGLRIPAFAYTAAMVVHAADHAFRGVATDHHHASWPGGLQVFMALLVLAISATMVTAALRNQRYAASLAIVIGFGSALLFLSMHLAPQMGGFTDSFVGAGPETNITLFSWITGAIGISVSVWLGVAGIRARRR